MDEFLALLKNDIEKRSVFIGRRNTIKQIENYFDNNKNLINVYGIGGIGKSTLLKELENIFEAKGVKVFKFDFNNFTGSEEFYENIYIDLFEKGIKAYYFFMAFYIYWQKKHPNETFSDYRDSKSITNKILSFLTEDLGIIVNSIFSVDISNLNKILGKFRNFSQKFGLNKEALDFIETLEDMDSYEIEQYLPVFLAMDLSNNSKTVFLFDTFERLFEKVVTKNTSSYEWIKKFISVVSKSSFIVVSGREKINFKHECEYISLTSLTSEDSEKLVKKLGVDNEKIIKKIVQSSKGHPFYITLAVEMYKRDKESFDTEIIKKEEIFNRFVQSLTENDIQKLEILSVARIFNADLFKFVYGKNYSDIVFQEMLNFSFFTNSGNYFSMHELMRESFMLRMSDERKKELHSAMFEYFYQKGMQDLNKLLMKEAVYHLINFADFEYIKNWYENIEKTFERKGEYEFLIDLLKEGFLLSDYKAYFLIKEALVGLEIKNYKILNYVILTLPFYKMNAEYLGAYYYLKRKHEYLYYKKLPFKKRKKFFDLLGNKYKNLELKIKNPDIKTLFLIDKAKYYSKHEGKHHNAKNILLQTLKIVQNDVFKVKILDNMAKLEIKLKNYNEAVEIALESFNIKKTLFDKEHIQFGISYEILSMVYKYIDTSKMLEYLVKAIKTYRKYYNKWHPKIDGLYNRLVFEVDEEFIQKNELEKDLYYLSLIKKLIQKNTDIEEIVPLIDKLIKTTEEKNRIDTMLLKLLISNSKNNPNYEYFAKNYLEKVLKEYDNGYEKRNIYYGLYQSYAKIKDLKTAEEYLLKVIEISKKALGNMYVVSLVEMIRFYKYEKKDYEKTKIYYEKLIQAQNDYRKVVTLLKYYYFVKERDLKFNLLKNALEEAKKENDVYMINEVLEKFAEFYKEENAFDERILAVYKEMADNFKKIKDDVRVDKVYGMIAEYYFNKGEYDRVFEYYNSQIELREKLNDLNKLVKGYRFKADLYYKTGDEKNALKYYEKALEMVEDEEVEVFVNISRILLKLYKNAGMIEQMEFLIDERVRVAENFGDEKYIYFAYETKLEKEFKKDALYGLKLFKYYFKKLSVFKYKKDLVIKFMKTIGKIDEEYANDLTFFLYENFLLLKDYEKAQKSFNNLKKYFHKYPDEKYKIHFYRIADEFINKAKYFLIVYLLKDYKSLFDDEFLNEEFLLDLQTNSIYGIFYEFKKAGLFDEALQIAQFLYKSRFNEMDEEYKEMFLEYINQN